MIRRARAIIAIAVIALFGVQVDAGAQSPAAQNNGDTFWASIRDSSDPADYEEFLQRYPDHASASFARSKLSALRPEAPEPRPAGQQPSPQIEQSVAPAGSLQGIVGPPPGTQAPGMAPTGRELARQLQLALQEIGCYSGGIDGDWGRGSQSALQRFNALSGAQFPAAAPSGDALNAVSQWQGGKCAAVAKKAAPKKKRASKKRSTKKKTASTRKKQPSRGGGVGVSIGIGGVGVGIGF